MTQGRSTDMGPAFRRRRWFVAPWTWALLLALITAPSMSAETAEELDAEARRAFKAGDFKLAAELAKRVYEIRRAALPPGDLELATAALNAGTSLRRAGAPAQAVPYLETACDIALGQFGDKHQRVGFCLLELVEALASAGNVARAREVASRALSAIEAGYPAEAAAAAVFHAGEIFRDAKDPESALRYFQQAAERYEPSNLDHPEFLGTSLAEVAQIHYSAHRYGAAAVALERTASLDREHGTPKSTAISRVYLLAACYRETGDYDKALALLEEVANALEGVVTTGHTVSDDILLEIARLQHENGGSDHALRTLKNVLPRASSDRTDAGRARRLEALDLAGEAHAVQQDYSEAEQSFRSGVEDARGAHDSGSLSETLSRLGYFLLRRGRYAEARACFDEALAIVESAKGRSSPEVAALLARMAVGLANQSDCPSARPVLERARKIYAKLAPQSTQMVQILKMVAICAASERTRATTMTQALALQRVIEGENSASWLLDSASQHLHTGDLANAAVEAERALALGSSSTSTLDLLAAISEERGRFGESATLIRESIRRSVESYGQDSVHVAARRFNLGRTLLRAKEDGAARDAFLAAAGNFGRHTGQLFAQLSLAEQQQMLDQQTAVQVSGILSTCRDAAPLARGYALIVPWKGLLIHGLRRQGEIAKSMRDRANEPFVARLRTVRTQIAQWASSRESRSYEEWKRKHDVLTAEKERLERRVLALPDAAPDGASLGLEHLRHALRDDEVFVDIYLFDQFGATKGSVPTYAAIVTGKVAGPRFVGIGPARNVDALVARWLAAVEEGGPAETQWTALRCGLWQPIQSALPQGARVVRISADGDLVRMPWHAFGTVTGRPTDLEVAEVNSARSLVNARARPRPAERGGRMVIIGGLDYDAGRTPRTPGFPEMPFKPLVWAKKESEHLEGLARESGREAVRLGGALATKSAVLQVIKDGSYVHFATHGFVPEGVANGRPHDDRASTSVRTPLVDSGLALSGANVRDPVTLQTTGILTAEEMVDADLAKSRLVVLSACQTGLGVKASGQGMLGLRSALEAAGARAVVMSLWSVDDEATQILMSSFYTRLWRDGKPLVQSFHEAQATVRRDPRFRARRFWAGWSIVDPES